MLTNKSRFQLSIGFLLLVLLILFASDRAALAQVPFYQGKTITIIQGRGPGGTGDLRVRTLVPFLQKYIPGSPTNVMEYMSGGGSRKAANHVFNSARPDGLILGNFSAGMEQDRCRSDDVKSSSRSKR